MRQRAEHSRRYARDAEHPTATHRDHRLVGHTGDGAYRGALDGPTRDDRRPVRREIGERTQPERGAAEQRHERARMQNSSSIVRELRGFAHIEKLHDPGAGNETRISRHHTGDILPQRNAARRERAPKHRRSEIRSAATQRDDMSIASHADEAGNDDDQILLEIGEEHRPRGYLAAREIGRSVSVTTVRLDEMRRVDDHARPPVCAQHRADDLRGGALAMREDRIPMPRSIGNRRREGGQILRQHLVQWREHTFDSDALLTYHESVGDAGVPLGELSRDGVGRARITFSRAVNGPHQRVGHTLERRSHDDASFIRRFRQQRTDVGDRGGAGKRGAAELVDGDRMCG